MSHVPYDGHAISVMNRVYNAIHNPHSADTDQRFVYDSIGTRPHVAAMWFLADQRTDWGGESDIISDYPILDRIYAEVVVKLPHWDGPEPGTKRHSLWDVYDEAMDLITETENRIWLAACVQNALDALEGDISPIWSKYDSDKTKRYIDEFKSDREHLTNEVRAKFADWMANNKDAPMRAEVGMLLLKSDREIERDQSMSRLRMRMDSDKPINLDYFLNEIKVGSLVRHIREGWEGRVVGQGRNDEILIGNRNGTTRAIADDLTVISEDPK